MAESTLQQASVVERPGRSGNGWLMLLLALLLLVGGITGAVVAGILGSGAAKALGITAGALLAAAGFVLTWGLTLIAPNQTKVLQLLGGSYTGTLRTEGLRWVNPLTARHTVSTRIFNYDTGIAKVNDLDGNPIHISAIVVWRVADTAKAVFAVDDYRDFISVQSESAVRHIAGSYPYDSNIDGVASLRESGEGISEMLSEAIRDRVTEAGVEIIESRINSLAYAPEIAQAMLRRQQASAVVAARATIVDGAVGLVDSALAQLEAKGVVVLDDERRAAMVSNLLVVLCADRDAQPVVNTGTLYS